MMNQSMIILHGRQIAVRLWRHMFILQRKAGVSNLVRSNPRSRDEITCFCRDLEQWIIIVVVLCITVRCFEYFPALKRRPDCNATAQHQTHNSKLFNEQHQLTFVLSEFGIQFLNWISLPLACAAALICLSSHWNQRIHGRLLHL